MQNRIELEADKPGRHIEIQTPGDNSDAPIILAIGGIPGQDEWAGLTASEGRWIIDHMQKAIRDVAGARDSERLLYVNEQAAGEGHAVIHLPAQGVYWITNVQTAQIAHVALTLDEVQNWLYERAVNLP